MSKHFIHPNASLCWKMSALVLLCVGISIVVPCPHSQVRAAGISISPYLIGQNAWYQPSDTLWPFLGRAGITSVRIGGHGYDLNMPDNATLLHWIDQIRSIGAEPIIQVPRYPYTGSNLQQLASNAANLVHFVNVVSKRHVRFWSIGNEPDLPGEYPCGSTEAQMVVCVANYVKAIAPAMRDVDSSLKIYAPDAAWFSEPKFGAWLGGDADITGADSKGRCYIDGISFHRYPFGGLATRSAVLNELHNVFPSTVKNLLSDIAAANAKHRRTGANALTWGLTEFNITYNNPSPNDVYSSGVNSFLNGQLFAEYIGQGMLNNAMFFNTWSINEGGGSGGAGDLGFLGGPTTLPVPRSSYYHMQMISHLHGSFVTSLSNQVNVPAISAMDSTQEAVMLLNEDSSSHTYTIRLNGDTITSSNADTQIKVWAGIAQQYTNTIAGQTSLVLIFDPRGNLMKSITYSLINDVNNQPPQIT